MRKTCKGFPFKRSCRGCSLLVESPLRHPGQRSHQEMLLAHLVRDLVEGAYKSQILSRQLVEGTIYRDPPQRSCVEILKDHPQIPWAAPAEIRANRSSAGPAKV